MPKSPPKPKKLTKKQMEEELKKQKEEEKRKKLEEARLKKEEEDKQRAIEEEQNRIAENKRKAAEEIIRLEDEEKGLEPWKNQHESFLNGAYQRMCNKEDWNKYSLCEEGYINIRNERLLNGFVCEFKDKCDNCFINNFKLVEKNFEEEMLLFDYSQLHYYNLERLLLQGKASLQSEQVNYAFKYMNILKDCEKMKIESFTRYFIENFEQIKNKRNDELGKGNVDREEKPEIFWEWSNTTGLIKLGFWANNLVQNNAYRAVSTKFKNIPIFVNEFHKSFITKYSIVRFFWCKTDIREYIYNQAGIDAFSPYMSISGCFFLDELVYPSKAQLKGTWQIREMIGDRYKPSEGLEGGFTKNVKMRYKIDINPKIYLKDINNVAVGLYDQSTGKWNIEQDVTLKKQERVVILNTTELGILSVLLERKINFPYASWYLRCVKRNDNLVALLDIQTPRTNFVFELGVSDPDSTDTINRKDPVRAYVKLVDNKEPEFDHLADKEFTFDQMILELKECGILIAPWKEDIEEAGLKEKNYITTDRAVEDIVMNCRYYAIRSHEYNHLLSPDIIAVKSKPNPAFDNKFFDDEEKDWSDFAWFTNKASIGKFTIDTENSIVFNPTIETTRPYLHLIMKDIQPEEVYEQVAEDDFSAAFLVNLRNFIRVLGLVHMP